MGQRCVISGFLRLPIKFFGHIVLLFIRVTAIVDIMRLISSGYREMEGRGGLEVIEFDISDFFTTANLCFHFNRIHFSILHDVLNNNVPLF